MRLRVIAVLGALAAGCGLSFVGTYGPAPDDADASADDAAPTRKDSASDAMVDDVSVPIPPEGETEVPLEPVDAGFDADDPDATPLPSFEIVAPSGGKFRILTPGAPTPCSVGGVTATSFRVENASSEGVAVRWYDYSCDERGYGMVGSGNQKSQPTYVGHRWRLRSLVDGGIRGDFVLEAPGAGGAPYRVILR